MKPTSPYDAAPGHKPPVLCGWAEDFSYAYYGRLLGVLQDVYKPIQLREAPIGPKEATPRVIMRHDVDVCPRTALALARFEASVDFRSTYLFLVNSPLYDVREDGAAGAIREIASLGHEVALHFDLHDELRVNGCSLDVVEEEISKAAEVIASVSGEPVRSVSFHRPIESFLRGPLFVAGIVNAYAKELMGWYLSDSNGCWREGEPIPMLQQPHCSTLQILVHPIWWGEDHMSFEDRLSAYHARQRGDAGDLDDRLFRGIGLRRRSEV